MEKTFSLRIHIALLSFCIAFIVMTSSCAVYSRLGEVSAEYDTAAAMLQAEGINPVPASHPAFYYDGNDWADRAVELINSARSYILIDTFLIGEHERTTAIMQALKAARKRGVRVHLVMDSASYYRFDKKTGDAVYVPLREFREAGISVTEYNAIRSWRIYRVLGLLNRDHRKFWIIDGETVAAGGMNIDPDSLTASRDGGSIDGMTEVYSPGVAEILIKGFIETWNHYSLDPLEAGDFPIPEPDKQQLTTSLWVLDQNMSSGSLVTTMFDLFLSQAKEELWMMQGYMILTPGLLTRIQYAADQGVAVHIILSSNHVSGRFDAATYYGIQDLLQAGARVYIYESPTESLLHKKMLLADSSLLSVGSANYNVRSQYLSREISFIFDDPEAAETIQPFLDEIMRHSREIDSEEAETYRGLMPFFTYLMMQPGG